MSEQNRWKGLVLGAVGGAAGTLVMSYYFQAVSGLPTPEGGPETWPLPESTAQNLQQISLVGQQYEESEGSTAAVGRVIYQTLAHKKPESQETKTMLSQLVHWNFGLSMASLYGMSRGKAGFPDLSGGLIFGSCVWLFGSEMMVPLLGMSSGPTSSPPQQHLKEWGAHLVYGVVTAATTQLLQRIL